MKIDLNEQFMSLNGTPLKIDGGSMTLRDLAATALGASNGGTPEVSLKRFRLAKRIYECKESVCEMTTEEASDLKAVIAQQCNSIVAGQAIEMIENGPSAEDAKGKTKLAAAS